MQNATQMKQMMILSIMRLTLKLQLFRFDKIRTEICEIRTPKFSANFLLQQKRELDTQLDVKLDCETGRNSDVERFLRLTTSVVICFKDQSFYWDKVYCLVCILKPFYEITHEVENIKTWQNFHFYTKSVQFIRSYVENQILKF